ncbi:hypothetical protein CHS0354_019909, partial [Potamilus streckersoni]
MRGNVLYSTQLDNTQLSNDSWLATVKFVRQTLLIKSGVTRTGNLDIGVNKITSTAFPTTISDLIRKIHVDDTVTCYTARGVAKYRNNNRHTKTWCRIKIATTCYPVSPFDLTNNSSVKVLGNNSLAVAGTSTDDLYVKRILGTITGAINMVSNKMTSTYVPLAVSDI